MTDNANTPTDLTDLTVEEMVSAAKLAFAEAWAGELSNDTPAWVWAGILAATAAYTQDTGAGTAGDFAKVVAVAKVALRNRVHRMHAELLAQAEQWGGLEHDVTHTPEEWWAFIDKQLARRPAAPEDMYFDTASPEEDETRYTIFAKVGALALSAANALHERTRRAAAASE